MYQVLTYTLCDGWINCWTITDDQGERLETFTTLSEAELALDEYIEEHNAEFQETDDHLTRDDFIIEEME